MPICYVHIENKCLYSRVQVTKLHAFQYMIPHCTAYKCLSTDKKQFPVNLTAYEGHWKDREDQRQAKLSKMTKSVSTNSTLTSLEQNIALKLIKIQDSKASSSMNSVDTSNAATQQIHSGDNAMTSADPPPLTASCTE